MRVRTAVIIVAVATILPAAAWAAFKPLRVLAPELLGLYCTGNGLCIDDRRRLTEAMALAAEASSFVNARVDRIGRLPRMVFCSDAGCARAFGFGNQAAYHVGTRGIVIGPQGWQPHIVRHELIHHLQMERIGSLHAFLFTPTWFIEGMAYSLSEDPRRPLPQPLEEWRSEFERWYPGAGTRNLWSAAATL